MKHKVVFYLGSYWCLNPGAFCMLDSELYLQPRLSSEGIFFVAEIIFLWTENPRTIITLKYLVLQASLETD